MIDLDRLILDADLDRLTDAVDSLASSGEWEQLVRLRHRARAAFAETGRQLWPAATYATYRLALDAPVEVAVAALEWAEQERFAPAPITEVVASRWGWDELLPHLPPGLEALVVAEERAARGDVIDPSSVPFPEAPSVPLARASWEPDYVVPLLRRTGVEHPRPPAAGPAAPVREGELRPEVEALAGVRALRDAVGHWEATSSGAVSATGGTGTADAAVRRLGGSTARIVPLEPAQGMRLLAWAAADGAALGRRRGMAWARRSLWWALTALTGLDDDHHPDELGHAVAELEWAAWDHGGIETGWTCRLAIHDPVDGFAWALDARDRATAAPRPT